MDVIVSRVEGQDEWRLVDLLGRPMGAIRATSDLSYVIEPGGKAKATMSGMGRGPFPSLDAALAAIETHTRGVCRHRTDPGSPRSNPEG